MATLAWTLPTLLGAWFLRKQLFGPLKSADKEIAMNTFKIELGAEVKDRITGLKGICVARSEWLYGCRRYVVQPPELKDGKPVDSTCFDEDSLEVLAQAAPHAVKDTGGPQPELTRHSTEVQAQGAVA